MTERMVKIDQASQSDSGTKLQNNSPRSNDPETGKQLEQNRENEITARQRVFNSSSEYKKREIVFGQIQRLQTRFSNLETKIDQILEILKSNHQLNSN
ncbi:MAG TPA: hypothetical protein VFG45_02130 [Candidatus Nitrosocosmicus sp.]|nr:hypothetical protein [Candidatus Nitrosocosmicus sp.]